MLDTAGFLVYQTKGPFFFFFAGFFELVTTLDDFCELMECFSFRSIKKAFRSFLTVVIRKKIRFNSTTSVVILEVQVPKYGMTPFGRQANLVALTLQFDVLGMSP